MWINCLHLRGHFGRDQIWPNIKTLLTWTKCFMNQMSYEHFGQDQISANWARTANLPDSQSHVLNPNPILPSGYHLQAPSGSAHLRHSFIHLCKFIQIEGVEATRVYLHSNSTQVWEETSHLMVWKVSATSVANQRSSEKLLKAPNNTWVLFWLAVWGQRSSTMTSNKNPFLVTAPPITLPHHSPLSSDIISQCAMTTLW